MVKEKKLVVGITMGELNGIGVEVLLKAIEDRRMSDFCTVVIYGSADALNFYRNLLKINEFNVNVIEDPSEAKNNAPNVISCWNEKVVISPGHAASESGKYAYLALERAANDLKKGNLDALVTAPIDKKTIQSDEFTFAGHTEFLTQLDEKEESLMVMVAGNLRVSVATGHIPLKDVSSTISVELICKKIELLNKSLIHDFGIVRPKIAVLGLNPHAGEDGLLGSEEEKIILPAIQQVKTKEIFAFGPFPADGFFGSTNFTKYDGILAMYHDQGLIPVKALAFDETVNYTAGLSFIRTSPDHGTAYAIAGKNQASPQSMRNAIYLACDIHKSRKLFPAETKPSRASVSKTELPEEIS